MASKKNQDNLDDIVQYYNDNQEEHRHESQQLEFLVTQKLLLRFLPKPCKVLELGSGSGHYTCELASGGHQVTAIELTPSLSEISQQRLTHLKLDDLAKIHCADARTWLGEDTKTYDVVVCMGPMYHLEQKSERSQIMKAMSKRLKKDGLLITTHLTKVGLMSYMLSRFPEWGLSRLQADEILNQGFASNHPRSGDFRGYYSSSSEIKELHKSCGQKGIQIFSQDPCIGAVDEIFNPLPQKIKLNWANILIDVASEPDFWGSGRSLICFSKKS